jgi:hypothetical protein
VSVSNEVGIAFTSVPRQPINIQPVKMHASDNPFALGGIVPASRPRSTALESVSIKQIPFAIPCLCTVVLQFAKIKIPFNQGA